MRSSLHKNEDIWGKLNSGYKCVYTSSGERMKIRFASEQLRVRAKNCESYVLWRCVESSRVSCV